MTAGACRTYVGTDSLTSLASDLRSRGAQRVLLVTGRASFERSGAAEIVPLIEQFGEVVRWSDFSPNPDVRDVEVGLGIMGDAACDSLVGIGGGSVMDMAKLLCAFENAVTTQALLAGIQGGERVDSRRVSLGLVPTTSGSGSEATHFAVVYIGDAKYSVAGPALVPDVVALDPSLALSGSSHQRATSGLDAICQAIESRWAVGATPRSRRYAEFALRLLLDNIEPFVNMPTLENSRPMQLGSHLSGRAINISKTTAAHALSYGITKQYGVDHGHAVALTLGEFIEDHAKPDARLQPIVVPEEHRKAMTVVLTMLGASDGSSGRANFYNLVERVGLESTLSEVGYSGSGSDLERLASTVNVERLGNNPVAYGAIDLVDLLRRAAR